MFFFARMYLFHMSIIISCVVILSELVRDKSWTRPDYLNQASLVANMEKD